MAGRTNSAMKLTDDETWQLMASKSGRLVLERYRAARATGSAVELRAIVDAVRARASRQANPGAAAVRYAATPAGTVGA